MQKKEYQNTLPQIMKYLGETDHKKFMAFWWSLSLLEKHDMKYADLTK